MNKYFLNFKDAEVEKSYQNTNQKNFRMFTLTLLTIGVFLIIAIRIIQCIVVHQLEEIYKHCLFICYLIIQYGVIKQSQKYLRIGIIILNHAISFFFQFTLNDDDDIYSSFIKGANIMGVNYVMLISGEFIDATVSVLSLTIFRLIYIVIKSDHLQYSIFLSTTIVILYTLRSLYHYHKAIRSQYQLSLVDSHWEKILNTIAFKQSYMIFSFQEETLNFKLKSQGQCSLFFNQQYDGMSFVRDALYRGKTLENFLYSQIKKYKVERASVFNRTLVVNHLKKVIKLECSIFYGKEPMILILFRDFLNERKLSISKYESRHRNFIKLLVYILGKIKKFRFKNLQCQVLRRKLLIMQLFDSLKNNRFNQEEISLFKLAHQLNSLYENLSVKASVSGCCNITTVPNILLLIILQISENTQSSYLNIKLINCEVEAAELEIIGLFDIGRLAKISNSLTDYQKLIFQEIKISSQRIYYKLNEQVHVPFWLSELGSASQKRIN